MGIGYGHGVWAKKPNPLPGSPLPIADHLLSMIYPGLLNFNLSTSVLKLAFDFFSLIFRNAFLDGLGDFIHQRFGVF